MQDLEKLSRRIEAVFQRIEQEQMRGIPLLNPALRVQCVGLQAYQGRSVGIVITPWLMNLLLLPAADEDWSELQLGAKQTHRFPANEFRFLVNEIDGIGTCQTHSLHSPMHEFMHQEHAVAAAESFMQTLMVEVENPDTDPHDEELLGRILRGEETNDATDDVAPQAGERCLTRRELLKKSFEF
jgi:[NiFe] hydrogenase assembly HybE family chaperone